MFNMHNTFDYYAKHIKTTNICSANFIKVLEHAIDLKKMWKMSNGEEKKNLIEDVTKQIKYSFL